MTQAAMVSPDPTPPPAQMASIDTRFGLLAVDPERLIHMRGGLLGFSDRHRFALVDLPDPNVPFKLLQSVDDHDLAFLVVAIDPAEGTIDSVDLLQATQTLGFDRAALAMLGIVTVRQDDQGVHFTVNLRAPLLIDTARREGAQHVLAKDAYSIRHPLPLDARDVG